MRGRRTVFRVGVGMQLVALAIYLVVLSQLSYRSWGTIGAVLSVVVSATLAGGYIGGRAYWERRWPDRARAWEAHRPQRQRILLAVAAVLIVVAIVIYRVLWPPPH